MYKVIEESLDNNVEVALFPRPRRFGKTLLMSTLNNFFDIDKKDTNKDLFNGLYINKSKYKNIQNTYPVINLSFRNLKQNTYDSVLAQFRILIVDIYKEKRYLLETLEEDKFIFKSILFQNSSIDV